jgi:UDP-3-O-[3-hydroxymyristoyl] glucosamine N-acyltransferase
MGGQAGAAGHIVIGKGVKAGGRAGLTTDTEPGAYVNGNPAMPYMLERRLQVLYRRLPDLFKRMDDVEKRLAQPDNSL